ncbi:MAG: tetratricopeptide repeat protein, partial [bacterium]|nr:tetratricopeptide repeat protein [bacterium]
IYAFLFCNFKHFYFAINKYSPAPVYTEQQNQEQELQTQAPAYASEAEQPASADSPADREQATDQNKWGDLSEYYREALDEYARRGGDKYYASSIPQEELFEALSSMVSAKAHIAFTDEKYTETVKWYKVGAQIGVPELQTRLGECYAQGWVLAQNPALAAYWFRKAANQHHRLAQLQLGACYCEGFGVEKNPEEGKKWFGKIESGSADGGTEDYIDYERATEAAQKILAWYNQTEARNPEELQKFCRFWLFRELIIPVGIYTDTKKYDNLEPNLYEAEKACLVGNPEGYALLESAARRGDELSKLTMAQSFLPISCKLKSGFNRYVFIFENKALSDTDRLQRYLQWLNNAAKNGSYPANIELHRFYANGIYAPKDESKALQYLKNAAILEVPEAMFNLGICYAEGKGCPKNSAEAVKWIKKAAESYVPGANGRQANLWAKQARQWIADRSGHYEELNGMGIPDEGKHNHHFIVMHKDQDASNEQVPSLNSLHFGDSLQKLLEYYEDAYNSLIYSNEQGQAITDGLTIDNISDKEIKVSYSDPQSGCEKAEYRLYDGRIVGALCKIRPNGISRQTDEGDPERRFFALLREEIIAAGYGDPSADTSNHCEWHVKGAHITLDDQIIDKDEAHQTPGYRLITLEMKADSLRTWQKAKIEGWEDLLE